MFIASYPHTILLNLLNYKMLKYLLAKGKATIAAPAVRQVILTPVGEIKESQNFSFLLFASAKINQITFIIISVRKINFYSLSTVSNGATSHVHYSCP